MLNRAILMGRLVADPELKTTISGTSVTSFRIAVERSYVKSGEERKADFIGIVCWSHTAEFVCRYFRKGSLIAVEGQLQSRTFQAKDGTNHYVTEVIANNVNFTGERIDTNAPVNSQQNSNKNGNGNYNNNYQNRQQPNGGNYQQPPQQPAPPQQEYDTVGLPDDDLPF